MSTYKVPQNVEAEDKILGPFTFRQFLYLFGAAGLILVAWLLSKINGWLIAIPLPLIAVLLILGLYHREDQPVESYLLAALNFLVKPRRRKWEVEGATETVKITAPKAVRQAELKSHTPARGQLEQLAGVMDSRGWAVKLSYQDRLAMPDTIHDVDELGADVRQADDILDLDNYPGYAELAEKTHEEARKAAIAKMQQAQAKPEIELPKKLEYDPYPDINQAEVSATSGTLKAHTQVKPKPAVEPHPVVKELSQVNDLHIDAIARQAESRIKDLTQGEEISLHSAA